jgi:TetR/AcrR family fatty acid metabolism transcriptional regulator
LAKYKKIEERKTQILKAAERVFAQKGFNQSTISEVAHEAGVSDATIYEYFSTKEELLFSIPLATTRQGKIALEDHLSYIRGAANKLRGIIYGYLRFYQNHPEYASVALLILKQNREFLKTEAYQLIREWSREIVNIVKEGIDSDEFKPDTNPYLVRSMILGTIEHCVTSWLLLGRYRNLLEVVDPLTDMVVQGIRKGSELSAWNINVSLEPSREKSVKRLTKKTDKK